MQKADDISERNSLSCGLLEAAIESALYVEDFLMDAFISGIATEIKSGYHDIVTKADRTSERMISSRLFRYFSNSTIIGEEDGKQGQGEISWYVDPIDGTNNFAKGIPFFCTSIAACVGNEMLAAVIYDPVRREMWNASLEGAFLNGKQICSSGNAVEEQSMLLSGFPYEGGKALEVDFTLYSRLIGRFRAVRRLGSTALELAYVACGRADATFQTNANSWDIAAGLFLVQQAGGNCYIPSGRYPGSSGKPWLSPRFIATCKEFDLQRSCLKELFV